MWFAGFITYPHGTVIIFYSGTLSTLLFNPKDYQNSFICLLSRMIVSYDENRKTEQDFVPDAKRILAK